MNHKPRHSDSASPRHSDPPTGGEESQSREILRRFAPQDDERRVQDDRGGTQDDRGAKTLVLAHCFPPAIDGGSQILSGIAKELEKSAQVLVLTSDARLTDDYINPKTDRLSSSPGLIRIKTIRCLRKPLRLLEKLVPSHSLKQLFSLLQTGPVFAGLPILETIAFKPDLIVAGVFPTTIPVYAYFLSRITRAKLVLLPCFHQQDQSFYRFPLIPILRSAKQILALSQEEADFYQKRFSIKKNQVSVYCPQIDQQLVLPVSTKARFPKTPQVLFLGNQSAHKRIELLIDACFKLDLSLTIAGQKTLYSKTIDQKIRSLPTNYRSKITIINGYDRQKQKQLLDSCSLLVNPSVHESLGLVFLESWARKKPVIAVDNSVNRQLIENNKTGFLFEQDNLDNLVKVIKEAIANPNKLQLVGQNAYQEVRHFHHPFDWAAIASN
ncbi:MAG: glycosyltransferase family 4 protein [Patescibacteria group bacterium]